MADGKKQVANVLHIKEDRVEDLRNDPTNPKDQLKIKGVGLGDGKFGTFFVPAQLKVFEGKGDDRHEKVDENGSPVMREMATNNGKGFVDVAIPRKFKVNGYVDGNKVEMTGAEIIDQNNAYNKEQRAKAKEAPEATAEVEAQAEGPEVGD